MTLRARASRSVEQVRLRMLEVLIGKRRPTGWVQKHRRNSKVWTCLRSDVMKVDDRAVNLAQFGQSVDPYHDSIDAIPPQRERKTGAEWAHALTSPGIVQARQCLPQRRKIFGQIIRFHQQEPLQKY